MDNLSTVGNWASIFGFLVSMYTSYKVESLPGLLRKHTRNRYLSELIDTVMRESASVETLPEPVTHDVERALSVIRSQYLSRVPLRHRVLKNLVSEIQAEMKGQRRSAQVQHHFRLIRNEILAG